MRSLPLLLTALLATPLLAAPSVSLVDNGGSATLNLVTDAPGALAAEIALELGPGLTLVEATVNETLFDDPNPGDNPYLPGSPEGGDTTGLWIDTEQNTLFASFGSGDLGVGAFEFLTFEYAGEGDASAVGVVAQKGMTHNVLLGDSTICDDCVVIDYPCGDFDNNGSVGDGDLTLLLSNWGAVVPPVPFGWIGTQPTAPLIGDDELTCLLLAWGGAAPAAVPEPAAAFLAFAAAGLLLARRVRS
ncbi:hypothetical protein MalM25_02260 [Planctomycetes bacterium MalM25]|nr:hypothetical protein MalM25_02260 [Planctomycetes bacterium MalM25]